MSGAEGLYYIRGETRTLPRVNLINNNNNNSNNNNNNNNNN